MKRRFSPFEIALAVLIVIGLLRNMQTYFIPILVLGIIFLLYKFPPSRWKWNTPGRGTAKGKRMNGKFRVINGNKDSESDDFPKYH
ncbi:hypothetical protein [Paenibacillus sp. SI8]|uniref:hypothetical protein n=1 Tax=unclassified Paenibacillus TaxID=185978 RepID=UPI00346692BE